MNPRSSNRLAWSVALVALGLWATSAPVTWGQVAAGTTHLLGQTIDQAGTTTTIITTSTGTSVDEQGNAATMADAESTASDSGTTPAVPCLPWPPAVGQITPPAPLAPPTLPAPPSAGAVAGTFHLCGPDSGAERAIEQLIAGRQFSASLASRSDGCADLTVRVGSPVTSGNSTVNLNVGLGSGRGLSIQIVSENGATHTSIGSGR